MRKLTRYLAFVSIILVISLVFVGCGNKASKDAEKQLTAGTYKGSAKGFDGDINVSTEIDKDGKISKVTVESHNETKGFGKICQGHKQNFFDKFISSLFLS